VIRVWSRVASAVRNAVPSSPTIRSAGIRASSKMTVRVGEPLMPSFFSSAPKLTPGSLFSTTKADMPWRPGPGRSPL
jgi:hypothetical protein